VCLDSALIRLHLLPAISAFDSSSHVWCYMEWRGTHSRWLCVSSYLWDSLDIITSRRLISLAKIWLFSLQVGGLCIVVVVTFDRSLFGSVVAKCGNPISETAFALKVCPSERHYVVSVLPLKDC
jgi:hypothetical protein